MQKKLLLKKAHGTKLHGTAFAICVLGAINDTLPPTDCKGCTFEHCAGNLQGTHLSHTAFWSESALKGCIFGEQIFSVITIFTHHTVEEKKKTKIYIP